MASDAKKEAPYVKDHGTGKATTSARTSVNGTLCESPSVGYDCYTDTDMGNPALRAHILGDALAGQILRVQSTIRTRIKAAETGTTAKVGKPAKLVSL